MELIASSTVGALGSLSIDFTSIPSTYTDLCVMVSLRDDVSSIIDGAYLRFNGDNTSGNYTAIRLIGSGSAASRDTNNVGLFATGATATASTFSNCIAYIPNYAGSTAKSVSIDNVTETNATTQYMGLGAFLWSGTAAINRVTISPETATKLFVQYSTAYLYGVKNA
jgi:hypothetical protein